MNTTLPFPERFREPMNKAGEICSEMCIKKMPTTVAPCAEDCLKVELDNLRHEEILRKLISIENRIMKAFGEGVK